MLQGEQDPEALADLARGRLREKREQLKEAVQGTLSQHHRFLLGSQLPQIDFLDGQLAELDQEVAQRLGLPSGPDDPDPSTDQRCKEEAESQQAATASVVAEPTQSPSSLSAAPEPPTRLSSAQLISILDEITGINVRIGEIVVAEVGTVVDHFATEDHLVCLRRPLSSRQDQCWQTA